MIHPLTRGAGRPASVCDYVHCASSPHTRGRPCFVAPLILSRRFIPSHEGQTRFYPEKSNYTALHPLTRGADALSKLFQKTYDASSPHTRGRHSVFMRLSADLNTSLCNLHKCHSYLIRIFNMPKNPPHFHFFSNYFLFFSTPITRDIPAPYDLDRPTPFLIRFRNAFASLTRSRNSYPNTLTG